MAGIYIHIPFCKTKCSYCDFYSITDLTSRSIFVNSLIQEFKLREKEIDEPIKTIYFGGGTPSVLSDQELHQIFESLKSSFSISKDCEITIETNPDDISREKVLHWKANGINRVSIGIQSLDDTLLRFLNRRHDSKKAKDSLDIIRSAGISNISADLIYGIPMQTLDSFKEDIKYFIDENIPHISAYHLTYEEGTPLYEDLKKKKFLPHTEENSIDFYNCLCNKLESAGYSHYEISNFALKNLESRHNSSYWNRESYLGFGPGAHSFNSETRRWNIASVDEYCSGIEKNLPFSEIETLTEKDKFNEYIMVSLRTKNGINKDFIREKFSSSYNKHLIHELHKIDSGLLIQNKDHIALNEKGWFISDDIIAKLFMD
jgi:oxygen-independent coproporphyrinogen-3 oxidase